MGAHAGGFLGFAVGVAHEKERGRARGERGAGAGAGGGRRGRAAQGGGERGEGAEAMGMLGWEEVAWLTARQRPAVGTALQLGLRERVVEDMHVCDVALKVRVVTPVAPADIVLGTRDGLWQVHLPARPEAAVPEDGSHAV